jgi:acetoin utilization protein AcuB
MRISQYMTRRLVTADPQDGLRKTFFLMRQHGIRHVLVLDGDRRLLGIVSDRDLRRPDWVDEAPDIAHPYRLDDDLSVGDVMTERVQVVHTYDSIGKAVKILKEHRFGALPVLDKEGTVVGILSAYDLLGAFDEVLSEQREKKAG